MHKLLPIVLFLLAVSKNWQNDPEWVRTRYGALGWTGRECRAGALDGLTVKDYAPKGSLVATETPVPKAKYPVIDVHSHVVAKSRNPQRK
jgi:hypothetical protein